ncbi:MAG: hypothetical protein AAGH90_06195 [Pseudomonadota bacterium]
MDNGDSRRDAKFGLSEHSTLGYKIMRKSCFTLLFVVFSLNFAGPAAATQVGQLVLSQQAQSVVTSDLAGDWQIAPSTRTINNSKRTILKNEIGIKTDGRFTQFMSARYEPLDSSGEFFLTFMLTGNIDVYNGTFSWRYDYAAVNTVLDGTESRYRRRALENFADAREDEVLGSFSSFSINTVGKNRFVISHPTTGEIVFSRYRN